MRRVAPARLDLLLMITGARRAEILRDLANYTDIAPVIQVSEVVVERSDR